MLRRALDRSHGSHGRVPIGRRRRLKSLEYPKVSEYAEVHPQEVVTHVEGCFAVRRQRPVCLVRDGRYLMIVRGDDEGHPPGVLAFSGGHASAYSPLEVLETTARREVLEETR